MRLFGVAFFLFVFCSVLRLRAVFLCDTPTTLSSTTLPPPTLPPHATPPHSTGIKNNTREDRDDRENREDREDRENRTNRTIRTIGHFVRNHHRGPKVLTVLQYLSSEALPSLPLSEALPIKRSAPIAPNRKRPHRPH